MSMKYRCPLCGEEYNTYYDAKDCLNNCATEEYSVEEIDTEAPIKVNPAAYVGKCVTCLQCDETGRTFGDCPHHGYKTRPEGCGAYEPDTRTFGMSIQTLWFEQRRCAV